MLERVGNQQPVKMGEIMLEAGYTKAMAKNPKKLIETDGWQELFKKYIKRDDLVKRLKDIAFDEGDKRGSLTAIDMLFKAMDVYPETRSSTKIEAINHERARFTTEEE